MHNKVDGYFVYSGANTAGPFQRETLTPVSTTSYNSLETTSGVKYYMVRAVKLQVSPSGSFYNPSVVTEIIISTKLHSIF